jgi:hypothetical protein
MGQFDREPIRAHGMFRTDGVTDLVIITTFVQDIAFGIENCRSLGLPS